MLTPNFHLRKPRTVAGDSLAFCSVFKMLVDWRRRPLSKPTKLANLSSSVFPWLETQGKQTESAETTICCLSFSTFALFYMQSLEYIYIWCSVASYVFVCMDKNCIFSCHFMGLTIVKAETTRNDDFFSSCLSPVNRSLGNHGWWKYTVLW